MTSRTSTTSAVPNVRASTTAPRPGATRRITSTLPRPARDDWDREMNNVTVPSPFTRGITIAGAGGWLLLCLLTVVSAGTDLALPTAAAASAFS